ncbi:MAG TPA: prepilin peptidase [Pirellulales bacterium]
MMHPAFLLLWLFLFGAIVGSFLNVVVYRLPRGMNIAFPGSHCPNCQHPIRWYDNIPVIGWLWLRGRCRDCGAGISIRYPLVEAATGAIFLIFAFVDVAQPYSVAAQAQAAKDGIALTDLAPSAVPTADYFAAYVFHVTLLSVLLTAALIEIDGQRLPRQLITWPAAIGILWACYWPIAQAIPLLRFNHQGTWHDCVIAFATGLAGMIAAVILRIGLVQFLGAARVRDLNLLNASLAIYLVGAFLGWLPVAVIGIATFGWQLIIESPARDEIHRREPRIHPTSLVLALTLIWCVIERPLATWLHFQ